MKHPYFHASVPFSSCHAFFVSCCHIGEVSILQHMEKMRASGQKLPEKKPPESTRPNPVSISALPFASNLYESIHSLYKFSLMLLQNYRPIIITKDLLQKKVFGAGYPSLPTYTVEEWFDQQVAAGNFQQPQQRYAPASPCGFLNELPRMTLGLIFQHARGCK